MKQSLPYLSALAAVFVTCAALADPTPAPPPTNVESQASAPGVPSESTASAPPSPASAPAVPAPPAAQSDLGDRFLLQVATQLERRASVTSKIRHSVFIGGQQLHGVGGYWQQGSGENLKVRLELQILGQDPQLLHVYAQLLQVCNSRFMWVDRKLPTGRNVTRLDLRQLRADPSLSSTNLDEIKPGEASWSTLQTDLTPYSGGLPRLLSALGCNFHFMPPQAMHLAVEPPVDAEPTSVPVFAVVGHWKPETLALILGRPAPGDVDPNTQSNDAAEKKSKPVPERVPEEILLLVGQSDLFPYRIEYRHLETPQLVTNDGAPIPYQIGAHPMVVLEFSDVVFDSPIAPGLFDYNPGSADWIDQTTLIRDRLRQQHQAQVATRQQSQPTANK